MVAKVLEFRESHGRTAERAIGPVTTFNRTYYATLADDSTDPLFIFAHKDCPRLGQGYKNFKAALVTRIKVAQVGQTRNYKTDVEWSTNAGDPSNDPDPLKRPAIIDINNILEEVATFRDGKGRIRINTAGDIQVGKTLKPFQLINVSKNVVKVPKWFHTIGGSVNKSSVRIEKITYKPRTLLLGPSARPDRILENEKWYYPLKYELKYDFQTHDTFEPSMGYHELVPEDLANFSTVNGKIVYDNYIKKRITVSPGDYPKERQYLDEDGRHFELEPDKKNGGLDTSKIHIIRRNDFREENLRRLPRK